MSSFPADTYVKLLDCVVSDAHFLTEGVFECDIAHCRSVDVLCMLYKIRCNQMHPLYGVLPAPYVPVRVGYTRCLGRITVYLYARISSLQNHTVPQDFYSLVTVNDFSNPVCNGLRPTF